MLFLQDNGILERLAEKHIDCFSLTIFQKGRPVISHCNQAEWLKYYWDHYSLDDPIRKFICGSKLRVLPWNFLDLDAATREYLKKRNEVTGVSANVSLFFQTGTRLAAVTIGTKQGNAYLMNFLHKDLESLLLIKRACFTNLFSFFNTASQAVTRQWPSLGDME